MTGLLAMALVALGVLAAICGMGNRRPALVFIGGAIIVSHGLPLALMVPDGGSASMASFWSHVVVMTALGSLSWLMGYWLLARKTDSGSERATPSIFDPVPWHIAVLVALMVLIGVAPGGPIGFAEAGFLRLPVESPLFSLTYAFACLAALTTSLLCLRQIGIGGKAPWLSMVLVLLIFWLLGGRTQLVITGLSFALLYLAHGRIKPGRLVLPAIVILGLALQTLIFRRTLQGAETDTLAALSMTLSQLSLLDGYAFSARYAAEAGFHPGHYWDVLQQIMPRAMFPEKPLQLSRALRLMEARDMLGGLTPGLIGEAYAAGGHVGVCGVGLLFGAVLAWLDNAFGALRTLTPTHQAMVVALIPILAVFVVRGGFDTAIFRLAVLAAGWLVLAWPIGRQRSYGVAR